MTYKHIRSLLIITMFLIALLLSTSIDFASAISWDYIYSGNQLPTAVGWTLVNPEGKGSASVSGGILTIDSRDALIYYHYRYDWAMDTSWTCEVRLRENIVSYPSSDVAPSVRFLSKYDENNIISIMVDFYTDRIVFYGLGDPVVQGAVNSHFRTYRFCLYLPTRRFEAYREVLTGKWTKIYTGTAQLSMPTVNNIDFGKIWSTHPGGISDWDYVAYKSGYEPPPTPVGGVWVPVDKLALLAPYITLAIAVVAVVLGAVSARKRWLGKVVLPKP